MPKSAFGLTGSVRYPPYMSAWPRGSNIRALRMSSAFFLWPCAPLDGSVARQTRQAAGNNTEGFTTGLDFNSRDGACGFHRCFMK